MEIPVNLPEFRSQRLSVEAAGLWRGPRLLLNGTPVEGKRGNYSVRNDAGVEVPVVIKAGFPDPIPKLLVGGAAFELARALVWHEYLWLGAPVVLIFSGGALGGLFGGMALYLNARIFRGDRSTPAKYGLTGLVSFGAVLAFLIFVIVLQAIIYGSKV